MNKPEIHRTRSEADRVTQLAARLEQIVSGGASAVHVVRAPLRISPLGAHIDHQLGCVTGMAVDRAILLAFVPSEDGAVYVESRDFSTPTSFHLGEVPLHQPGDWGNYLRGAVLALRRSYTLQRGIIGVLDSDMPIGGLSSSAAVTIAYLLALEAANELSVTPQENINWVTHTEHDYVGLNNGILDQTSILFSRRNSLTYIDCQAVQIERIAQPLQTSNFAILAVYSGVAKALVGTNYNNRVAECQAAARHLLTVSRQPIGENPRLRLVDPQIFAQYGEQLDEPLRRRATHFFGEMERVEQGQLAWRAGDLVRFGQLVTASGASSIDNYEAGCPQLITLYRLLRETPGVYGVRFSGAGFRGSCLALINPAQQEVIAEAIHRRYPLAHPEIAEQYSIHLCQPADAAQLIA
jgi:galactokinase